LEESELKSSFEVITPRARVPRRPPRGLGRRWFGVGVLAAALVFIGTVGWYAWQARTDLAYNMDNLIRLHVVANSDSEADQAVKLEVRDAILESSGDLLSKEAPDDAVETVKASLPAFRAVAERVLAANGYDYPVNVEFGTFFFPERRYGALVLPEGDYQALRVVLGEGKGANWWCILFPPLCYLDVAGGTRTADWSVTDEGLLASGSGQTVTGAQAIPLAAMSDEQMLELQLLLGQALTQAAGKPDGDAGSRVVSDEATGLLITDIPAVKDADLIVLVADTGTEEREIRFYVVDRLRDLMRAMALKFPWFFGAVGAPTAEAGEPGPDR